MATDSKEAILTLHIVDTNNGDDKEELHQFTQALIKNIKAMDVESVSLLDEQKQLPGAKGNTLNGLLVVVLPIVLPKIIDFLQSFVVQKNYTVRAKVQKGDRLAEIEYPVNISQDKLEEQLEVVKQMVEE